MRLFLIILPFALFLLSSCRKDDPVYPLIKIVSPDENSTFMSGDTIKVNVNASAEKKIDYIRLVLLNSDYTNVSSAEYFYPVENSVINYNFDFKLGNPTLQSGEYFLMAEAKSGDLSSKDFLKIELQAIPKKTIGYFIFTGQNSSTSKIFHIDSMGNKIMFTNLSGDLTGGCCNSKSAQIASIGRMSGSFNVFSFPEADLVFSVPVIPDPPFPYFEKLYCVGYNYYISLSEGRIKSYTSGGSLIGDHGYQPYKTLDLINIGEKSYAIQYSNMSTPMRLSEIYTSTGYIISSQQIFFNPVKLIADGTQIVIVANKNSKGIIYLYDTYTHSLTAQSLNYPNMEFITAVSLSQNNILIAGNNNLYIYNPEEFAFSLFSASFEANKLAYDFVNRIIICAKGKEVNWISYPGNNLLKTESFNDSIKNIDVLYNY